MQNNYVVISHAKLYYFMLCLTHILVIMQYHTTLKHMLKGKTMIRIVDINSDKELRWLSQYSV
jgi:hypothetical protein